MVAGEDLKASTLWDSLWSRETELLWEEEQKPLNTTVALLLCLQHPSREKNNLYNETQNKHFLMVH